jgi:hypothetical protein
LARIFTIDIRGISLGIETGITTFRKAFYFEYFADKSFICNILQSVLPRKLDKPNNLHARSPSVGRGRGLGT